MVSTDGTTSRPKMSRAEREAVTLDVAARLFYARGVHEVGMDELVRETGLGKATVYRLFPTKDTLIGAYLHRLAGSILAEIDRGAAAEPGDALHAILDAVQRDLQRPDFRGCPFNNASIEYADPAHPARLAARDYRSALLARLHALTGRLTPDDPAGAAELAGQLASLIDGAYTNAAHLGAGGPAAAGLALAHRLIDQAGWRGTGGAGRAATRHDDRPGVAPGRDRWRS